MKAVILEKVTDAKDIKLSDVAIPKVCPGWVLVKIKAFGMNHSEQILRQSEIQADYIRKPVVPGIECAGEIADPSDSRFKKGQKVIAMMGGMGRSFNGSYAEYALLPTHHVFSVESDLSWEEIAAVPETYYTVWGSLFECLNLKPDDVLLVRGATCALGYAAIQIAKALGCKVVATTHKKEKFDPIKDIPNGVYLTGFYSNYPTQEIVDAMFQFFKEKNLRPVSGKVFVFEEIKDAILAQETGSVNGKIIIKL